MDRRRFWLVWVLALAACAVPARTPQLVWEAREDAHARSAAEASQNLRPLEPGRSGAAWGASADASFRLLRTTVAEQLHVHDDHDLTIVMLQGTGVLEVDDHAHAVGAGDVLYVERGRIHRFRPDAGEPVVALAIFTPQLDQPDTRVIAAPGEAERDEATAGAPRSR